MNCVSSARRVARVSRATLGATTRVSRPAPPLAPSITSRRSFAQSVVWPPATLNVSGLTAGTAPLSLPARAFSRGSHGGAAHPAGSSWIRAVRVVPAGTGHLRVLEGIRDTALLVLPASVGLQVSQGQLACWLRLTFQGKSTKRAMVRCVASYLAARGSQGEDFSTENLTDEDSTNDSAVDLASDVSSRYNRKSYRNKVDAQRVAGYDELTTLSGSKGKYYPPRELAHPRRTKEEKRERRKQRNTLRSIGLDAARLVRANWDDLAEHVPRDHVHAEVYLDSQDSAEAHSAAGELVDQEDCTAAALLAASSEVELQLLSVIQERSWSDIARSGGDLTDAAHACEKIMRSGGPWPK